MLRDSTPDADSLNSASDSQSDGAKKRTVAQYKTSDRKETQSVNADPEAQKDASHGPTSDAIAHPTGLWPVFRNRNFLTLWSGQVFSQMADKIYLVLMIAIISEAYESPGQSISGWVSAIMIAFTIPAILFGSLAGVYVDRWQKKPVLVWTNVLRGLLVAVLPLVLWTTQGWDFNGWPVGSWHFADHDLSGLYSDSIFCTR